MARRPGVHFSSLQEYLSNYFFTFALLMLYIVLNLILFRKRQKTFDRMLSAHRGLTAGCYTRLMFIAIADIIFMVPITLYVFCMNAASLVPWISWEETHFAFNVIYV